MTQEDTVLPDLGLGPRVGDWMQTYTGKAFYPLDARPEDVDPVDIAHALAMLCRYGGHVWRFYSVAEHCVLLSQLVSPDNALWALLHDATEAYMQDLVRPIKRHMPGYVEAENRLMAVIAGRFGLDPTMPVEVKEADSRIIVDERAALLGLSDKEWSWPESLEVPTPLGVQISAWTPEQAQQQYLNRLYDLGVRT